MFERFKLIPQNLKTDCNHLNVPLLGPGSFTMLPDIKVKLIEKECICTGIFRFGRNTEISATNRIETKLKKSLKV